MESMCILRLLMKTACIVLAFSNMGVQPFILDATQTPCFPEFPCTCSSNDVIICNNVNLTEIPSTPHTDGNRSIRNFDLGFNDITSIPTDAFVNISSLKDLRLDDNKISQIDDNGFAGVEDSLTVLTLRHNRLTKLSDAFLRLPQLSVLSLEGNPISSLDPVILSSFGKSLRLFSISLTYFSAWPSQLHYLMHLGQLRISDIPFSYMPLDAFNGFDASLSLLEIGNSSFRRIPSAICHLTHLRSFVYEDNPRTEDPILEPCRTPLGDVTSVRLRNNNLDTYPDIMHTFPNTQDLVVMGNPKLVFIDNKVSNQSVSEIINLDVSSNGFERIPSALRFYDNVKYLNVSFNFIKTVEYGDLGDLQKLKYLYLQGNPLLFIDVNAFTTPSGGVFPISDLDLQMTLMGRIPEAVAGLPNLVRFKISGKQIECSCSMKYLQHWSNITVEGQCEFTAEPLHSYISGDLQRC